MKRFICSFLIILCVLGCLPVSASAAIPPDITWCRIESFDEYAVLHFETPAEYAGQIDGYELRTADVDWIRISDGQGGTLHLPNGGTVYLRCTFEGFYSAVKSIYVQFGEAYIMQDNVSDASVAYRASSDFPSNAYLSADRITSGKVFEEVQQAVQASKHFELYDIYFLYAQGLPFDPKDASVIRLPLGDKLKRGHCKVWYVDEVGKRMLVLESSYDRTCVTFRSCGAGLYFVTDEWDGTAPIAQITAPAMGSMYDFYPFATAMPTATLPLRLPMQDLLFAYRQGLTKSGSRRPNAPTPTGTAESLQAMRVAFCAAVQACNVAKERKLLTNKML